MAMVLVPFLALGGLEAALRMAGFGYSTNFFKRVQIGNEEFFVENDKVGLRFFPPELARIPSPVRMKARKPVETCRIFILGESAAMGDPEPAYGAGRYLEVLLRDKFPGENFEVVNVAMTAINSHAILPIARECARHEGDLWIVYMGNNEMVGPFGAATIFGPQAPPLGFVRLSLAIQKTRVGQLLITLGRGLKGKSSNGASWGGMQMFMGNTIPPGDPRKDRVCQNFEKNLDDILHVGLDSGVRIVLSTVAVNLKDSAPFASMPDAKVTLADRTACKELYGQGSIAEDQGDFAKAAQLFESAAGLDDHFAELQFRLGDCLLRLADNTAAQRHFQLACDLDALPFRADSHINSLITRVGQRFADQNVHVLDANMALETNNLERIPGAASFYEHVHFNFDGNYRLAQAWAAQVENFLPLAIRSHGATDWLTQKVCEERLGLTDWNRCEVIDGVIRRMRQPPLSSQPNNPGRVAALQSRLKEMRNGMNAAAAAKAREVYAEALKRSPDDYYLHEKFADFLVATGDLGPAIAEWQKVRVLIPQHYLAYFEVGRLLGLQGKLAEARSSLLQAIKLRPVSSDAWFELARTYAMDGKLDLALKDYEQAQRLEPQDYRIYCDMGKVLAQLNRRPEAAQRFRDSIRINPDYWEAHFALGGVLGSDNNIAEARTEFETLVRLNPENPIGHLNLGVALMKLGQLDGAIFQFGEAIRLDPGNKLAADYLGQVQALKNRNP
ncbi:MAG: hypothetical protein JWR26_4761 [Pedosphaera sp.]|nr:hypothetical protein [Pedosphaera sp.]